MIVETSTIFWVMAAGVMSFAIGYTRAFEHLRRKKRIVTKSGTFTYEPNKVD